MRVQATSTFVVLTATVGALAAPVQHAKRDFVCAAADDNGGALVSSTPVGSGGAINDGSLTNCKYPSGICQFFTENGTFSSGSSTCPSGMVQGNSNTDTTTADTTTSTPPPPPQTSTIVAPPNTITTTDQTTHLTSTALGTSTSFGTATVQATTVAQLTTTSTPPAPPATTSSAISINSIASSTNALTSSQATLGSANTNAGAAPAAQTTQPSSGALSSAFAQSKQLVLGAAVIALWFVL